MSGRQRLLVAYRLRDRAAHEVDAFRRALGSSEIERIAPHITLVPPVNVDADRIESLGVLLEQSVTRLAPFPVSFNGVGTFAPLLHVIYLRVTDGAIDLEHLRAQCQVGELVVSGTRPFVPHVTLKSHANPELVTNARAFLSGFSLSVEIDRVTLLRVDEQSVNRRWREDGEFVLGSAMTLGRGSEEVLLSLSSVLAGADRKFVDEHGGDTRTFERVLTGMDRSMLIVRARIGDTLVGLLLLSQQGAFGEIDCLVVDAKRRNMGTGRKMLAYLGRVAGEQSIRELTVLSEEGTRGFFVQCGFLQSPRSAEGTRSWLFERL